MTDLSFETLAAAGAAPSFWSQVATFFAAWAAARACASALEFGRLPAAADLRSVGIDPKAFASIRLR